MNNAKSKNSAIKSKFDVAKSWLIAGAVTCVRAAKPLLNKKIIFKSATSDKTKKSRGVANNAVKKAMSGIFSTGWSLIQTQYPTIIGATAVVVSKNIGFTAHGITGFWIGDGIFGGAAALSVIAEGVKHHVHQSVFSAQTPEAKSKRRAHNEDRRKHNYYSEATAAAIFGSSLFVTAVMWGYPYIIGSLVQAGKERADTPWVALAFKDAKIVGASKDFNNMTGSSSAVFLAGPVKSLMPGKFYSSTDLDQAFNNKGNDVADIIKDKEYCATFSGDGFMRLKMSDGTILYAHNNDWEPVKGSDVCKNIPKSKNASPPLPDAVPLPPVRSPIDAKPIPSWIAPN